MTRCPAITGDPSKRPRARSSQTCLPVSRSTARRRLSCPPNTTSESVTAGLPMNGKLRSENFHTVLPVFTSAQMNSLPWCPTKTLPFDSAADPAMYDPISILRIGLPSARLTTWMNPSHPPKITRPLSTVAAPLTKLSVS